MPTISVIIPTYNRSRMLAEALNSIYQQTLPPHEVIVVDDGSEDDTAALVSDWQTRTAVSTRYYRQSNAGPGGARNRGIGEAQGAYLAFLDSDDIWHPKKLEVQYAAMAKQPHYHISHTRETWFRRGLHLNQKKIHQPRHGMIFNHSLQLCCVGMSTVMVKRQLFDTYGLFDESLRCCEDYDLWLRIGAREPFLLVDQALTEKRGGRQDQVSTLYRVGMDRFRIQAIARLLRFHQLSEAQQVQAFSVLKKKCVIYGNGCHRHGKPIEGDYYLRLPKRLIEKGLAPPC